MTVFIVVNGDKFQNQAVTLTYIDNALCQTCLSYFHILQYVQVSSGLNHNFLSYRIHRQTHTDTQTDTQTHMSTL